MSFELAIDGVKALLSRLNIDVPTVIARASSPVLETAEQQLTAYPPAPPHSHRTGNLGRSWAVQVSPAASVLRSSADYAQYVVGPAKTAKGWQNVDQVAAAIASEATAAVEKEITDTLS